MVYNTYKNMHEQQTVENVQAKMAKWTKFDHCELGIMDAIKLLSTFIDESDPDIGLPNEVHAFQTAEGIRRVHPDNDWFQLTGLIHDLGKIMALYGEPQHFVVGDTYVVGCAPGQSIVHRDTLGNCPDMCDERYSTKYGMYSANCGLENVIMSWGHDEYMYRVLTNHKDCTLPEEALYMIRYHSFYPWHKGDDYTHLCNEKDSKMLPWVRELNKFDLYTKCPDIPDMSELIPYYQTLVDKYIPGIVKF